MARTRTAPTKTLTAAAHPVSIALAKKNQVLIRTPTSEQAEAWEMYDALGVVRFIARWLGKSCSRCRIVASDIDPETGQPTGQTTNAAANSIVRQIAGGPAGQAEMLGKLAVLLSVPGEGYIAIINTDGGDRWLYLSSDEVTQTGSRVEIALPDRRQDQDRRTMTDEETLTRVYQPHPRDSSKADSLVISALSLLRRLRLNSDAIDAVNRSRLIGNGVFLLPEEISMPVTEPAPPAQVDPDAPGLPNTQPEAVTYVKEVDAQTVSEQFVDVASTALENHDSAAAMVPIVMTVKGEYIKDIKHVTFGEALTDTYLKVEETTLNHLSMVLDAPPEALKGLGTANHWGAWLVSDQAISLHVAPLMTLICDALTTAIFRPLLKAAGEDPDKFTIWFDTTPLALRPNRGADAKDAHKAGAITSESLRRELGFDDQDAYPDTEVGKRNWAWDQIRRDPTLLPVLAPLVGLPAPALAPVAQAPEVAGDPVAGGDGVPETQDTMLASASPAQTGAQVLARFSYRRALDLASKRRKTAKNLPLLAGVSDEQIHSVLGPVDPATAVKLISGWDDCVTPEDAHLAGVERERLKTVVTAAAVATLTTGTLRLPDPHLVLAP